MLPGLAEYLAETQKMSVEYLDALSGVAVGSRVNQPLLANCALQMSEVIGEAARLVLPESMGVNLLPKHIVDEAIFAKKRPYMLAGAALLAASVVPPFLFFHESLKSDKSQAMDFSERTPILIERADKLAEYQEQAKTIEAKIAGLEGLAMSKSNWINLFIDIERRLMEQKDVWLDNLRVHRAVKNGVQEYKLELTGRLLIRDVDPENLEAYDTQKAIDRITKLLNSFVSSEFLKSFENVRTDPSNPRILKFDFTLVVNPDKPI